MSFAARSPTRVTKPERRGGPGMPPNLLHGQDAKDVAVYVAKCAGVPKCGVTAAHPPEVLAALSRLRRFGFCRSRGEIDDHVDTGMS